MLTLLALLITAQPCRTTATEATTKHSGRGFTAAATTSCQYDKTTNKSTCTTTYEDSLGTKTTTTSVSTFATLDDAIDETTVIPPRRRSIRTDTTGKGSRPVNATSLVNTYDQQNRLVKENGSAGNAATYTTTYTAWDEKGRPTEGKSVSGASTNTLDLSYDDAKRTLIITTDTAGQRMVCTQAFDVNGNPVSSTCRGTAGSMNNSTTTTTATEKICR
jgi:hypothetical protein